LPIFFCIFLQLNVLIIQFFYVIIKI